MPQNQKTIPRGIPMHFMVAMLAVGTSGCGGESGDGGSSTPDAFVGPDALPNPSMSFFATSIGNGSRGGDLGGLTGADAKCQELASRAGAGARTWRAYLSSGSSGPGPIAHARDRIGSGPWFDQKGDMIAASLRELHDNGLLGSAILDESGAPIPSSDHDILTGTAPDGTLSSASETCNNWTNGTINSQAQVGHADTQVGDGESWNGQHSGPCDAASLLNNAGTGRLYCFAID